jgi:PAS domain-containing protein
MSYQNQYEKSILRRNEAIYVCDSNGIIKLYNKAASELWGREPITDKDLYCGAVKTFDISGTEIKIEEYPVLKVMKKNNGIQTTNLVMLRPDGTYKKVLQSSTPIYNSLGQITGTINLLQEFE